MFDRIYLKLNFMVNSFELINLVLFLLMLRNVQPTMEHDNYYLDTHRNEKQMSLESCLGRFDVHGNTIIRTGESQAIGGKFLQGLELETPEKCQRLCCETADCDVYVFEEKNDGYCYLFQCGSPKNFHCKFTRHANYTSALLTQFKAVLTTTPRPSIHLPLVNMSTQEQELVNLKVRPEKYLVSSTTQTIVPVTKENGIVAAPAIGSRNFSCGRFEFPCHSGECIAVYNACNGIPQCVDGSDEGPECSEATNNKPSNNYHEHSKPEVVMEAPSYRHNFKKIESVAIDDTPTIDTRQPQMLNINQKNQIDITNDLDRTSIVHNSNPNAIKVLELERNIGKPLLNQREMYAQLPDVKSSFPTPQIAKDKVHIFNENAKWPTQRQQYHVVTHEPPFSGYDQPSYIHIVKNRVQPPNDEVINIGPRIFNQDSGLKPRIPSSSDYVEKTQEYVDYVEKPIESSKKETTPKKNEIPMPATTVKKAPHPAFVEQYKVMEQHLEIKFTDHDGLSEKPRGAVLSLTLGLMVTGVIVILIGCRLRTVGRRGIRHGGKVPYAPDEDFLVNGMYL